MLLGRLRYDQIVFTLSDHFHESDTTLIFQIFIYVGLNYSSKIPTYIILVEQDKAVPRSEGPEECKLS